MESNLDIFNDPNFSFDENSHTYTYNDKENNIIQTLESVTSFINRFKEKKDWNQIAKKFAFKNNKKPEDVLNEWKNKSEVAIDLGKIVHKWIEDFYKGMNPDIPEESFFDTRITDRINQFKKIYFKKLSKLTPIKQEFRIFSKKWNIAGTTDIIFNSSIGYLVGDWKTNENFTTNDHPKGKYNKLLYPFNDLWENNLNVYSIQLSLYRLILEEEASFKTKDSFLVWIGPEEPKIFKALDLRDRLYDYLNKNNNL